MSLRAAPRLMAALWGLAAMGAAAQPTAALQPLAAETITQALARPIGQPVRAPRTSGTLELQGKRVYVAEYMLLFDLSGELPATPQGGQVLGTAVGAGVGAGVGDKPAVLAYRSAPDIGALQLLTDRAWADLQARLQTAGVPLADPIETVRQHGAVYAATEPASTALAPVVLSAKSGDTERRYLALAPTGMRLVARTVAGIGLGNLAARVAFPAQGVEGLSLAMALHFSALDTTGQRPSTFAAAPGAAASQPAISPLMELAPAPAAALVHAHAQLSLVNLGEALVLAGEFARLRPQPAVDAPLRENLGPLLSLGRRLLGGPVAPRVEALLELDGPSTARLALYALFAGNQAIADALKAARQP